MSVNQSATQTAIDDRIRRNWEIAHWVSGAIFWTVIVFAFCFLVFRALHYLFPEQPRASGAAIVNAVGDVVAWDAHEVVGRDMLHQDFFALLPENKRDKARLAYLRALDGEPYQFPRVSLDGGVRVTFERQGNVCVATLTKG